MLNRKSLRILLWILPLLWSCFIWHNSLQPAVDSSAQSMQVLGLLDPVMQLLPEQFLEHAHFLIRKTAHAFEFAMLGVLWFSALSGHAPKRRILFSVSASVLTAVCDETIQLFVPGRSGQLSDICLDSCSAFLAVLLCSLFVNLRRKHG